LTWAAQELMSLPFAHAPGWAAPPRRSRDPRLRLLLRRRRGLVVLLRPPACPVAPCDPVCRIYPLYREEQRPTLHFRVWRMPRRPWSQDPTGSLCRPRMRSAEQDCGLCLPESERGLRRRPLRSCVGPVTLRQRAARRRSPMRCPPTACRRAKGASRKAGLGPSHGRSVWPAGPSGAAPSSRADRRRPARLGGH
jgi:hypothetical protein